MLEGYQHNCLSGVSKKSGCGFYIKDDPSKNDSDFLEYISKTIVIAGDFNLNFLNSRKCMEIKLFFMYSNSIRIVQNANPSLIDNIFTNCQILFYFLSITSSLHLSIEKTLFLEYILI